MFDITLRRQKDALIDPIARFVPEFISPDGITFTAFACGIGSCAAIANDTTTTALTLWFLNRFLDCLDGSLARHRKIASEAGGFVDLLCDFIIYSLIPIAVAYGQDPLRHGAQLVDWLSIAVLEATFHVNNFVLFYSAAVAAQRDDRELTSVTMRPALIEGFESGVLFTLMLAYPQYINQISWVMSIGVFVGIGQRVTAVSGALGRERNFEAKSK